MPTVKLEDCKTPDELCLLLILVHHRDGGVEPPTIPELVYAAHRVMMVTHGPDGIAKMLAGVFAESSHQP
jgi:hypothetical protein